MVPNKVGPRLKPRVNLAHTNESKVGHSHGKSFVEAFEVAMSSLDNKLHDTIWYLDSRAGQRVIGEKKNVLDSMNHSLKKDQ